MFVQHTESCSLNQMNEQKETQTQNSKAFFFFKSFSQESRSEAGANLAMIL